MIRQICNTDTGQVYTPAEFQSEYGAPALIGLQRSGENGFTLYQPHEISDQYDAYIILHTGPEPAENSPVVVCAVSSGTVNRIMINMDKEPVSIVMRPS